MEDQPQNTPGGGHHRTAVVALLAVFATLLVVGAGVAGFTTGEGAGADLSGARAAGTQRGTASARAELDAGDRSRARRTGQKSGYRLAYRRGFRESKRRVAAGGPRVCGDAKTSDTPSITKVRAEGVGCAAAMEFARGALSCGDGQECQGYSCSSMSTNYEEGEMTCRRAGVTIRFLSGV